MDVSSPLGWCQAEEGQQAVRLHVTVALEVGGWVGSVDFPLLLSPPGTRVSSDDPPRAVTQLGRRTAVTGSGLAPADAGRVLQLIPTWSRAPVPRIDLRGVTPQWTTEGGFGRAEPEGPAPDGGPPEPGLSSSHASASSTDRDGSPPGMGDGVGRVGLERFRSDWNAPEPSLTETPTDLASGRSASEALREELEHHRLWASEPDTGTPRDTVTTTITSTTTETTVAHRPGRFWRRRALERG